MALKVGGENCGDEGSLAKALHDFMIAPVDRVESPGMGAVDEIDVTDPVTGKPGKQDMHLKRFCFNLANIIIDHIVKNMEIKGVTSTGDVTLNGVTQKNVVSTTQSNDGQGRVA